MKKITEQLIELQKLENPNFGYSQNVWLDPTRVLGNQPITSMYVVVVKCFDPSCKNAHLELRIMHFYFSMS